MTSQGLKITNVKDSRSNVKHSSMKDALIYSGPSRVSEQIRTAVSWDQVGAPIQTSWTINPKTNDIIDRCIKMRYYFQITATGGGDWKVGDFDAMRQMPLHSIMETQNVRINGIQVSDTISDKIHALLCYGNDAKSRVRSWSTTAAQPDQTQDYGFTLGSARNVACSYGENSAEVSRGAYTEVFVNNATPTILNVVVTEPIFLAPFDNKNCQDEGFVNVNQIDVNVLFRPDVSRIMSHGLNAETVTSCTVTQSRAPELLYNLITPASDQVLPSLQILPYSRLNTYPKPYNYTALEEVITCRSDNFKLSIVPDCMYIFAKRSRSTQNFTTTDCFAGLERLRVEFNNEVLFTSSSQQQLFDIACKNGCNLSYPQFSRYRGSVMKVNFGSDIGLPSDESPRVQCQGSISIEAEMRNLSSDATLAIEFFVVFQYGGTLSIAENTAQILLGNLTKQDVLMAKQSGHYIDSRHPSLKGGSFWSSLKSIVNKVASGVEMVAPLVALYDPLLAPVAGAAGVAGGIAKRLTGGKVRRR